MRQADIDDGVKDGLTIAEQAEIAQLRRKTRRLEMENEILRRAGRVLREGRAPKWALRGEARLATALSLAFGAVG